MADVAATGRVRRPQGAPVPREGEEGLFSQSWFPICLSSEVPVGKIAAFPFLDGRVVVFRDAEGVPAVMSAYCPHFGADLANGELVGNQVQCPFHRWKFDSSGRCTATGCEDPAPGTARLFRFPTVERWGMVFAFNGVEPRWNLDEIPFGAPDREVVLFTATDADTIAVDPWVVCCNTPDVQHIRAVHGVEFARDPMQDVTWTEHSMLYDLDGKTRGGLEIVARVGIFGTSIFVQESTLGGEWFQIMTPLGLPCPGQTKVFYALLVERKGRSEAEVAQVAERLLGFEKGLIAEDLPILNSIRYSPGTLTRADRLVAKFLAYLRSYPRAHPSVEFIR